MNDWRVDGMAVVILSSAFGFLVMFLCHALNLFGLTEEPEMTMFIGLLSTWAVGVFIMWIKPWGNEYD